MSNRFWPNRRTRRGGTAVMLILLLCLGWCAGSTILAIGVKCTFGMFLLSGFPVAALQLFLMFSREFR